MISALVLVGVILLASLLFGSGKTGPLTSAERAYLICAPLPVLLAFVAPGAVALLRRASAPWSDLLSTSGLALSGVQVAVGLGLLLLRRTRRKRSDHRLVVALLIAAVPLLLVGVVMFLYFRWG